MDRGARPIAFLIRLVLLAAAAPLLAADRTERLQALVWTAPGHEAQVLTRQPATCLDPGTDPARVRLGMALFNAPDLLGGQARRAGIACASCHSNGRRNAWFFLDGISAEPGSADVSASFFSLGRADGRFDPKPIPDLARPGKIARDPASGALERFLDGLVVQEFAGARPSAAQLDALASYVRAVRPCADREMEPVGMAQDLGLVAASIDGAIALVRQGDAAGARVLASAARHRLGLIDERLVALRDAPLRQRLLAASRALEAAGTDPAPLAAWQRDFTGTLAPALRRAEPRSLYDPRRVAAWARLPATAPR